MSPSVAAIVLAAGRGTRFGEKPKMLALLHGKPLVRHAVEAALRSGCAPVLVVTGHRKSEVEAALADCPVGLVDNPAYAEGLSTSLQAGFAALPPEAEAAIVCLGDMPLVTPDVIDSLVESWRDAGRPDAAVPTYEGRRGNPVLLSVALAPEIGRLTGDVGAGPLLRRRDAVTEVPVDSVAVTLDIDTPEALGRAQASTTPSSTAE